MENLQISREVQDLTDLELAVLLSLIAQQHCLIETEDELLDDLASELSLIVSERFRLSYVVLSTEHYESMVKFGEAILATHESSVPEEAGDHPDVSGMHSKLAEMHIRSMSHTPSQQSHQEMLDTRRVVHVVIAKNFNLAGQEVQIQALELVRRHRIFSRTTVHPTPSTFLFLPLITASKQHLRLNHHLNDRVWMSHLHTVEDGFPNLEDDRESIDGQHSERSLDLHLRTRPTKTKSEGPVLPSQMIESLRKQGEATFMSREIRRYLQDIVTFLRMERGVDGGITPFASTACVSLSKYLAPLHGIDYVTPSLVTLAARKVYHHRILIAPAERERSMQYGSDVSTVHALVDGLTPDIVLEKVLSTVDCPL